MSCSYFSSNGTVITILNFYMQFKFNFASSIASNFKMLRATRTFWKGEPQSVHFCSRDLACSCLHSSCDGFLLLVSVLQVWFSALMPECLVTEFSSLACTGDFQWCLSVVFCTSIWKVFIARKPLLACVISHFSKCCCFHKTKLNLNVILIYILMNAFFSTGCSLYCRHFM